MSEPAIRLQGLVVGQLDGPQRLWNAWTAGTVSASDLQHLLPDAWTRSGNDQPEQVVGTQAWVRMFRAAGFVAQPTTMPALTGTMTVYRGASEQRSRGMAWTTSINTADRHRQRCERFQQTAYLYTATVVPAGVLGAFDGRGEQEIVVDPQFLCGHQRIIPLTHNTATPAP